MTNCSNSDPEKISTSVTSRITRAIRSPSLGSAGQRIGIISDVKQYRKLLKKVLSHAGFTIALNTAPRNFNIKLFNKTDIFIWIIVLEQENEWGELLTQAATLVEDRLLISEATPLAENTPEFTCWKNRILSKVMHTSLTISRATQIDSKGLFQSALNSIWRKSNILSTRLHNFFHRPKLRNLIALVILFPLIATGCLSWLKHSNTAEIDGHWVIPQRAPVAQPILLEGQIEPGTSINIGAPFDGTIVEKFVQPGDLVNKGDSLFTLASPELEAEQRDAQSALIRSQQLLEEVKHWLGGSEVAAAKRHLTQSQANLTSAQRHFNEVSDLYEKGIVPRTELEAATVETANAQAQVIGATESLTAAIAKGDKTQLKLAELDLTNKKARLDDIQTKLASTKLVAPLSGVVMHPATPATPAAPTAEAARNIESGSYVSTKDTLITIGDTTHLSIAAELDEYDILRVRPGLPVQITLSSNETVRLLGELTHISSQAKKRDASFGEGSGTATFPVNVLIREISPELRSNIRIGMNVRMQLDPEAGKTALLVPLGALRQTASGKHQLLSRIGQSEKTQLIDVELGNTLVDTVEVRDGLTAQDLVWVDGKEHLMP